MLCACTLVAQTTLPPGNDCSQLTIDVTVVDAEGRPVVTLDKTAFQVRGVAQAIVADATLIRDIPRSVLLIDVSGSMIGSREKSALIKALAEGIITASQPNRPLALVTFAERIGERVDFAASKDSLSSIVERLGTLEKNVPEAGRRTALWDALQQVSQIFPDGETDKVIFLITDGGENNSRTQVSDAKVRLLEAKARMFTLLLDEIPLTAREAGRDSMLGLSESIGGRLFRFGNNPPFFSTLTRKWNSDPATLREATSFGSYVYAMSSIYYRVVLALGAPLQKRTKLTLEVAGPDGKKLSAFYPHQLLPCGTATRGTK